MKKRFSFLGADSEKDPGVKIFKSITCCIALKLSCLGMIIFSGAIVVFIAVGTTSAIFEKLRNLIGL